MKTPSLCHKLAEKRLAFCWRFSRMQSNCHLSHPTFAPTRSPSRPIKTESCTRMVSRSLAFHKYMPEFHFKNRLMVDLQILFLKILFSEASTGFQQLLSALESVMESKSPLELPYSALVEPMFRLLVSEENLISNLLFYLKESISCH